MLLIAHMCVYATNALAHDEEYRSILYWGHEVRNFSPCGSEKVYAVSGSSWVLGSLYGELMNKKGPPYQAVYIFLEDTYWMKFLMASQVN